MIPEFLYLLAFIVFLYLRKALLCSAISYICTDTGLKVPLSEKIAEYI